jgi:hypothetical protein
MSFHGSHFHRNFYALLKANLGSKSDLPVIVGPISENYFIANFQPQTDWPQEGLNSSSGIQRPIYIVGAEVIHATCKGGK